VALRFVDTLALRLQVEEGSCAELPPELPGELRCGRFERGHLPAVAHAEAFRLAGRGIPVLELSFPGMIPRHQLARLPGFEPLPQLPGFYRVAYLVGEHRVSVWVEITPRDGEASRRIVFAVEPLDGPFPLDFPAVGTKCGR
jgi:hypothetical protein